MEDEIRRLKEQLLLATHHCFGKNSEGFSPDQIALFTTPDVEIVVEEKDILQRLPSAKESELHNLLPYHWQEPSS